MTLQPFHKSLQQMAAEIFRNNEEKGWIDDRSFGDDIALLHSEVSEALEAWREIGLARRTREDGKPDDVASELADVLIRLLDMSYRYQVDMETEYERKMLFNRSRSYRHGGKAL